MPIGSGGEWTFDQFFFFDCETTGLELGRDHLLEAAGVLTDRNLNEIARFEAVVAQPPGILDPEHNGYWHPWTRTVYDTHKRSGLLDQCAGTAPHPLRVPALDTYDDNELYVPGLDGILSQWLFDNARGIRVGDSESKPTLAGCSPWWDWAVLQKWAPGSVNLLYYRPLDASGLKSAILNWAGREHYAREPKKDQAHRAMPDALYALERMRKIKTFLEAAGTALGGRDKGRRRRRTESAA